MMTEIQKQTAHRRLLLGISNVGLWVLLSLAGLLWFLPAAASALRLSHLFAVLLGVITVQSLFDLVGGTLLMPSPSSGLARFLQIWFRGMFTHTLLLCAVGVLSYWSFRLSGGFGIAVAAASLGLFSLRRQILHFVSGIHTYRSPIAGEACWIAAATDPSFTGGTCGLGQAAKPLLPESWQTQLAAPEIQTVVQRRLWEIKNRLPARALLLSLAWNLAGCAIGSRLLEMPLRSPESALLFQCCWMTLWSFAALLLLPSWSRGSVFHADRIMAARGLDVRSWIHKFPAITGEDGNAKTLLQRIFYPIPSAGERTVQLEQPASSPNCGNVARVNLFLSLSALTILGRCVHCNVGRPELWIFPPVD
ncbi:MAG: hypothetical protein RLZZ399_1060 [Verrucomicrobiota bacterium]